ncbi:glycoside hydrolase family 18 protein [Zavarzinia sp.]|uniref:glycoside hydrolase family 18 protein n=1 Tax=Zavarzinia sp. TaxID=2027920 RepID=UPI003568E447
MRLAGLLGAALAALVPAAAGAGEARPFIVYHESWFERPATGAVATTLAWLPPYASTVVLSFAKPDLVYPGGLDISGTGLEYQFPGSVLHDAVARLKHENPETKVLLGIGGDSYKGGWPAFDVAATAKLVKDLGADGIDLDYEPPNPGCERGADGRIACASDPIWRDLVRRIRAELPRPYVLTIPVWSVGAYGEGEFAASQPVSGYTGVMLDLLRSPEAAEVDALSIMSYEAGPHYDPAEAFRAYRTLWKGPLAIGINVISTIPGDDWSVPRIEALLPRLATPEDPQAGAMLYAVLEHPADGSADGRAKLKAICRVLGLEGCAQGLP